MDTTTFTLKNAGLLLAHPFLKQLFKYVDYLNDKEQFKDASSSWKAVYLLHYMASGETGVPQATDLRMPKLLTGMSQEALVPQDVVLTQKEKENGDEVLQVIISQWDKLGKTSNEGLRNTFLKRLGVLVEKDAAYQLTIETSGADILLDYIPWNISVIKLPWVDRIIYTSWR